MRVTDGARDGAIVTRGWYQVLESWLMPLTSRCLGWRWLTARGSRATPPASCWGTPSTRTPGTTCAASTTPRTSGRWSPTPGSTCLSGTRSIWWHTRALISSSPWPTNQPRSRAGTDTDTLWRGDSHTRDKSDPNHESYFICSDILLLLLAESWKYA